MRRHNFYDQRVSRKNFKDLLALGTTYACFCERYGGEVMQSRDFFSVGHATDSRDTSKYSRRATVLPKVYAMLVAVALGSTTFSPNVVASDDHTRTNPHYETSILKNKCEYLANTMIVELDDHHWKRAYKLTHKIYRTARSIKRINQYE